MALARDILGPAGGVGRHYALCVGTLVGLALGPLGPRGPAGARLSARTAKPPDPASAGTGPVRFPRLLLPALSRRLPKHRAPGASPIFEKQDGPTGLPHLEVSPLQQLASAEPDSTFPTPCASPRHPPGCTAATRDCTSPDCLPLPRRLSTWETCEVMPRRGGGFHSVARPLSGAGGSGC